MTQILILLNKNIVSKYTDIHQLGYRVKGTISPDSFITKIRPSIQAYSITKSPFKYDREIKTFS